MVLVLSVPATSSPVESHAVILNEDQVAEISYLVLEVTSMSEDPNLGSPLPLLNKKKKPLTVAINKQVFTHLPLHDCASKDF
jgi:hypothetical protein